MTTHAPGAVLVGVDNSSNSNIAAAWAVEIARATGSPIRAVTAWTGRAPYGFESVDDPTAEAKAHTGSTGAASSRATQLAGLEVTAVEGPDAEVLLKTANELDASLIVVGTRG